MPAHVALDEIGPKFADLINKHKHDFAVYADLQLKCFEELKEKMINIGGEKVLPALPSPSHYDANGGRPTYIAAAIRRQHDLHARYQHDMLEEFDKHPKLDKRAICILLFGFILPFVVGLCCAFQLGRLTAIMKQVREP